jgi:protein-S-isoprenylcysteine O-methyltransferase Ste14
MSRDSPLRYDFPLWAPLLQVAGVLLFHALLPLWLSFLAARYGWSDGYPSLLNLLGLIPIAAGGALLVWVIVLHDREAPKRGWGVEATPFEPTQYLITRGPYAYTRNPIYLSYLAIWPGWTLFYGSVTVAVGALLLWLALSFIILPYEERGLTQQHGEAYRRYREQVHRWFGRHARSTSQAQQGATHF